MNKLPITPFGSLKTDEEYFRFGAFPVRLADVKGERYKQPDSGLIYFRAVCNDCKIDEVRYRSLKRTACKSLSPKAFVPTVGLLIKTNRTVKTIQQGDDHVYFEQH